MVSATQSLTNEVTRDFAKERLKSQRQESSRLDIPDFGSMVAESNIEFKKDQDKKKAELGDDGKLRVGETKDDKEFRDMLERISGKPQRELKNKLEKEDFLNLMVTQLKYQDPTQPADHKDMAAQLAQFNSVEQLVSANKSLEHIAKGQEELKSDKLSEYLGKQITVKGNDLRFDGHDLNTRPSFHLEKDAGTVSITIKNEAGEPIRTLSLGNLNAGDHALTWDGNDKSGNPVAKGSYKFEVSAAATDGKPIDVITQYTTEVTGISSLDKGGQLETAVGIVKPKDIVAIRQPGAQAPTTEKPAPTARVKEAAEQYAKQQEPTRIASPGGPQEQATKTKQPSNKDNTPTLQQQSV
jgi:flagellar basal-body rod modification protein FlgD